EYMILWKEEPLVKRMQMEITHTGWRLIVESLVIVRGIDMTGSTLQSNVPTRGMHITPVTLAMLSIELGHNILVCNGRHNFLGVIGLFRLLLNFGHLCFNGEGKLLLRYRVESFFLAYR
ncbi:hypothetical protein BGW80DRAFT_1305991, partial [Lactifluus volemus]